MATATRATATLATATLAAAKSSADDPANRVVAISVDGLNPKAITELGRSGAPNFYRLMREGASTLNARTAREQRQPIRNGDLADLATDVLDLPRVPGSQFDRRRTLTPFR
ncbi:MAG TPA: hypothetical protein VIT65_04660 [Microlunatus sp.]